MSELFLELREHVGFILALGEEIFYLRQREIEILQDLDTPGPLEIGIVVVAVS